jgi:phospholipid-binding lipoprotein MlaA
MNPMFYLDSGVISTSLFALEGVDLRADHLSDEKIATEAALDRYSFFKSAYFQRREYLVNDGKVPDTQYEMELE